MDDLLNQAQRLANQTPTPIAQTIAGRIAYVVSHGQSYASHGYAIRTQGVASALNQQGLETLCFVRPGRPWELLKEPLHIAPEVTLEGVRYIHTRWLHGEVPKDETAKLNASVERFIALFRIYRPSAVLAGSNWAIGLPAWVAAKRLGLPFYNEVRGFWELSREAREPGYANEQAFQRESERDSFVAKQAQAVFTLNEPMKAELVKRGIEKNRIGIVPNAVNNLPEIKPADKALKHKLGIADHEKLVGYVGSFSPYEGLDVLLEACAELVQKGENLKLLLVGDDQLITDVAAGNKAFTNQPWLIQVGRVPNEQVADYFALLDAVVIPRQPLAVCELVPPMKAAEALAYGKRLIVSDVAALAEYADKYEGVVSFEVGSAERLAQALQGSLKLPAPKPNAELLFSAHTELMVKALKGEWGKLNKQKAREPLITTEPLIELALHLAKEKQNANFTPTEGRVAVVASYPCQSKQLGYAQRIKTLVEMFQSNDWEALCMVSPFGAENEKQFDSPETCEDCVRYLHAQGAPEKAPISAESSFRNSVEQFTEWFKTHKPQVIVAAGDFTSALPAVVAACRLSLPVVKEHLHYSDAFQEQPLQGFFERLDFAQKYAAEQACLALADANYYLYPGDEASLVTLQQVVQQVCRKEPQEKPLATLKSKASYTVKQSVEGEGLYYLELDVKDETSGNAKGVVASFRFLSPNGKSLSQKLAGFSASKAFPQYQYIDTSSVNGRHRVLIFQLPTGVSQVEVDIVAFVTREKTILQNVKIDKVSLEDVARWLSLKAPGVHWIKAAEPYVHKEGAASLRLALLHYKHKLSKHPNDLKQLDSAIQEMIELDRTWLPDLAYHNERLKLPATDRLTVAHLHKTAYPYENTGGAIRCLNTALSQQRLGVDPYIITPIGYPRFSGVADVKNHEVIEGVEHYRIGANTDGLRGISLPDRTSYSAFHIAKLLKSRGASLIHAASGVRGYELALQALALKKLTGLPLLYEVRSFHEHTWTPVRNDVMELERTQLRVLKENFCMEEADFVTTISYSMKKILIERGVKPDRIEVIPNAIDENKYLGKVFEPAHIPMLNGADFVVGYISNMSRREGHKYLIEAIEQLRQGTGLDIRGLFVGNGPERESLENLALKLGMKDLICFSGEIDHNEINAYYKAIDLFVIPRIPDYAADWVTPLKPYEAMALERPVIVTDLPALKEIVGENEERGLVAKPADVESLVEKLKLLIEDSTLRKSKVATAKQWVFAERTWSANAKRYESIYRRLIEENVTAREVQDA